MPSRKGTKTHTYSLDVHQSLIKTFLGKNQVLDINNKWKKVSIKIHPPQPTEPGKEKNDNADFFKIVIEGKVDKLRQDADVQEFYLGIGKDNKKSYREIKHYKRRKRWLS